MDQEKEIKEITTKITEDKQMRTEYEELEMRIKKLEETVNIVLESRVSMTEQGLDNHLARIEDLEKNN